MITLTESAADKLKSLLEPKEYAGIRPAVRGGGCSGFSYKLEFSKAPVEGDRVLESHGVSIHIDKKSYLYLMGTEIDWIDGLNQSGFKFINPNAKRTCGCGESFSV